MTHIVNPFLSWFSRLILSWHSNLSLVCKCFCYHWMMTVIASGLWLNYSGLKLLPHPILYFFSLLLLFYANPLMLFCLHHKPNIHTYSLSCVYMNTLLLNIWNDMFLFWLLSFLLELYTFSWSFFLVIVLWILVCWLPVLISRNCFNNYSAKLIIFFIITYYSTTIVLLDCTLFSWFLFLFLCSHFSGCHFLVQFSMLACHPCNSLWTWLCHNLSLSSTCDLIHTCDCKQQKTPLQLRCLWFWCCIPCANIDALLLFQFLLVVPFPLYQSILCQFVSFTFFIFSVANFLARFRLNGTCETQSGNKKSRISKGNFLKKSGRRNLKSLSLRRRRRLLHGSLGRLKVRKCVGVCLRDNEKQ